MEFLLLGLIILFAIGYLIYKIFSKKKVTVSTNYETYLFPKIKTGKNYKSYNSEKKISDSNSYSETYSDDTITSSILGNSDSLFSSVDISVSHNGFGGGDFSGGGGSGSWDCSSDSGSSSID